MDTYDRECLEVFLRNQSQLFKEPIVETMGETAEFLEEIMAAVVDSEKEVIAYFEENGMDTSGMTQDEIINQAEVFKLPKSGRFLIVEA